MLHLPGKLEKHILYYDKLPEAEYDPQGIPYGIQPDFERPYLDSKGNERCIMLYRPSTIEPMLLARSLFVLSDETEEGTGRLLVESGLMELAEREKAFVILPLASTAGWNVNEDSDKPDDVDIINHALAAAGDWYLFPGRESCLGFMMGMVAVGDGASMAQIAMARHPEHVNSLLTFGGRVTAQQMPAVAEDAEMFVWMVNQEGDGYRFWCKADDLEDAPEIVRGDTVIRCCETNRAKQIRMTNTGRQGLDGGILLRFWEEAFRGNVRIPGIGNGKVFNFEEMIERHRPCIHIDDRSLGDNGGIPHHWYEFIPESVQHHWNEEGLRSPLIIEMHGGGCWPKTSVAKVQLQELGEREGFITVYANASVGNSWNSVFRPERANDVEYITALVEYLKRVYPVDPSRVYVSGFSNGSGMAQVMAGIRPDLFAGLIAFNTRYKVEDIMYQKARISKEKYDYRMPVFYNYGTKDAEYPMMEGCGQFTQMQFWKWFNNIEPRKLLPEDPSGVGTPGDEILEWGEFGPGGKTVFTTHKYRSLDDGNINYYNYTMVEDLPHTVERRLIEKAWAFVSQFSRMPDGSLRFEEREDNIL